LCHPETSVERIYLKTTDQETSAFICFGFLPKPHNLYILAASMETRTAAVKVSA